MMDRVEAFRARPERRLSVIYRSNSCSRVSHDAVTHDRMFKVFRLLGTRTFLRGWFGCWARTVVENVSQMKNPIPESGDSGPTRYQVLVEAFTTISKHLI